jgi:hypothetical protein
MRTNQGPWKRERQTGRQSEKESDEMTDCECVKRQADSEQVVLEVTDDDDFLLEHHECYSLGQKSP